MDAPGKIIYSLNRKPILTANFLLSAWLFFSVFYAKADWHQYETARLRLHLARLSLIQQYENTFYTNSIPLLIALEKRIIARTEAALHSDTQPPIRTGIGLEAYLSMIDDSPQPFWRYLPPQWKSDGQPAPLLVFLHGYDPSCSIINMQGIPLGLTNLANRVNACIVTPFARGNTDFQGIGEQDVIIVIDEMVRRFNSDPERVVLIGYSMGGMGAWCMGARLPHLFNAILILCGRGDYYVWQQMEAADFPLWQQRIIDMQFASSWVHQMNRTPLLALHGTLDALVSYDQGLAIYEKLKPFNPNARFITLRNADHYIYEYVEKAPVITDWLEQVLIKKLPKSSASKLRPGETGSQLQNALQQPFIFVGAGTNELEAAKVNLHKRGAEWQRFAHAMPRQIMEAELDNEKLSLYNLFVFGEPENSPLIKRIFNEAQTSYSSDNFIIQGRTIPRNGNGLWLTSRNPFNTNRTAVVQCGIAWGERLPGNHLYDRIPDIIAYTEKTDCNDVNIAIAAGFLNNSNQVTWLDPPTTPAIKKIEEPDFFY